MTPLPSRLGHLHHHEPHEEPEESWLLSYLDVFALIATLFIVLTVLTQLRSTDGAKPVEPTERTDAGIEIRERAATAAEVPDNASPDVLDALPSALQNLLNDAGWQEQIAVIAHADYTEVQIRDRILFASAEADLLPDGQALLARLAPLLKASDERIYVEGHTDNQPISTTRFQSNWELAAARATTVVHQFQALGIPAKRLRAVSVADSEPIASNQDEAGRAQNRRVSLLLRRSETQVIALAQHASLN